MKTITGTIIEGNHINAPMQSCKPIDVPTRERINVTIDGTEYNRAVYQRLRWRSTKPSTVIAEFVIVNGTNYEVREDSNED